MGTLVSLAGRPKAAPPDVNAVPNANPVPMSDLREMMDFDDVE
jgi:hypothetical protein